MGTLLLDIMTRMLIMHITPKDTDRSDPVKSGMIGNVYENTYS